MKNKKQVKDKQTASGLRVFFGMIIMIVGAGLYLYPTISEYLLNTTTDARVEAFNERYGLDGTATGAETDAETEADAEEDTASADDELYQACAAYNEALAKNGQSGLVDAWSYETAGIDLNGFEEEMFGYIYIPAMDVTLSIYLGASTSNMAKGAAVLGQTSIPIGGTGTNAVIAGHRGYRGSPYFREIEKLAIGDYVYVTNPWGTLTYRVFEIDIIEPDDMEAIKIQEGKDMITLLTCHPYRSHGKYRYLVYCERVEADTEAEAAEADTNKETDTADTEITVITSSDGSTCTLSSSDIQMEDAVRKICGLLLAIIAIASVASAAIRYRKEKS